MKRKFMPLVMLSVLFLFAACKMETSQFDNIRMEGASPAFLVPLLESTLTFKDLAERDSTGTLVMEESGVCYLLFEKTVGMGIGKAVDDIMGRLEGNKTLNFHFTHDNIESPFFIIPNPDGSVDVEWISENCIDIDNNWMMLRYLYPSKAYAEVDVNYTGSNKIGGFIEWSFASPLVEGGKLGIQEWNLARNYPGPVVRQMVGSKRSDNPGYLDFFVKDYQGTTYNGQHRLKIRIKNCTVSDAAITNRTDLQDLSIDVKFSDIVCDSLSGSFKIVDLGQYEMLGDISVPVFKNTFDADIHFEEPELIFAWENRGPSVSLMVDEVKFARSFEGDTVNNVTELKSHGDGEMVGYPYKVLHVGDGKENEVGHDKKGHYGLNKDNSNLADFFDIAPTVVSYKMKLSGSGTVAAANESYTISRKKGLDSELKTTLKLPLHGWANFLTKKIVKNNPSDKLNLPDINLNDYYMDSAKVILHLRTDNTLPIEMDMQVYFYDDNVSPRKKLDSLIDDPKQRFIKAAKVGGNRISSEEMRSEHEILYDYDRYKNIQTATSWEVKVGFHTSEYNEKPNNPVKIMKDNALDVWLGVELQPRIGRTKKQQQK